MPSDRDLAQQYSEELVELLARADHDHDRDECNWDVAPDYVQDAYRHKARVALDALSSAGRLVPEGSEVREEFAARLVRSPGGKTEIRALGDRAGATEIASYYDGTPRGGGHPWRWSASVVRRCVITTPWTPAESAQRSGVAAQEKP